MLSPHRLRKQPPRLNKDAYGDGDVTTQGNRTYFRSVYLFLEAAKDRAKVTPCSVRKGLGQCL